MCYALLPWAFNLQRNQKRSNSPLEALMKDQLVLILRAYFTHTAISEAILSEE